MRRLALLAAAAAVAAVIAAAPAMASAGPPSGTFYAFGETYRSVITPTSIPNEGPFDTLYMIPGFAPVSDAAPGHGDYNGGRWMVVLVTGNFTEQPTSAEEVLANATSTEDTGVRFVCPLIPIG